MALPWVKNLQKSVLFYTYLRLLKIAGRGLKCCNFCAILIIENGTEAFCRKVHISVNSPEGGSRMNQAIAPWAAPAAEAAGGSGVTGNR